MPKTRRRVVTLLRVSWGLRIIPSFLNGFEGATNDAPTLLLQGPYFPKCSFHTQLRRITSIHTLTTNIEVTPLYSMNEDTDKSFMTEQVRNHTHKGG